MPPRILILGYAKSGTTNLYFKIKNALTESIGLFEPADFDQIAGQLQSNVPLVAKVLIPNGMPFFEQLLQHFPKIVLIVRDPRDVIISALLYGTGYENLWHQSDAEIAKAIHWLE